MVFEVCCVVKNKYKQPSSSSAAADLVSPFGAGAAAAAAAAAATSEATGLNAFSDLRQYTANEPVVRISKSFGTVYKHSF